MLPLISHGFYFFYSGWKYTQNSSMLSSATKPKQLKKFSLIEGNRSAKCKDSERVMMRMY